ncbi:MAG: NADH:ubiquinone oxidoreductase subunit NDUFA12 [Pseudomonadota bacterium]
MLKEIFAWWTGNTWGTRFSLWWANAERVGHDDLGNTYYRAPERYQGQGQRRWVIYAHQSEASTVPPGWHGWLHHQYDVPPSEQNVAPHAWEKPHMPNMTGTALAYRPPGSSLAASHRPAATGDYEAWRPE